MRGLAKFLSSPRRRRERRDAFGVDFSDADVELIQSLKPFTMTDPMRVHAMIEAVRYVARYNLPGEIVECGVWRGGSMMAAAKILISLGRQNYTLRLFDTFEGMSKPTDWDVSRRGTSAMEEFERKKLSDDSSDWCKVEVETVKQNLLSTGYDPGRIILVKGKVEDTLPQHAPHKIALLRLDTDFYESTRHELVHLYPLLVRGGIIIVDDYGRWRGSQKATDEYLQQTGTQLFLSRVDYTARIGVKL